MQKPAPSIVPFPRLFAVLGYGLFWFFLSGLLLDSAAWLVLKGVAYRSQSRFEQRLGAAAEPCRGRGTSDCHLRTYLDLVSSSPAYDGMPWAEEYWREWRELYRLGQPYEPFTEWRNLEWHSRYINVDATPFGVWRRSNAPANCVGKRTVRVWFFGGSSTFGEGTPDFATVPSYLSDELNGAPGECFLVTNFGVRGFNSNQELIELMEQLKVQAPPDIAVFLDGANDAYTGVYSPARATAHTAYDDYAARLTGIPLRAMLRESSLGVVFSKVRAKWSATPPSDAAAREQLARRVQATLDNYEQNLGILQRLGRQSGFATLPFWQPLLGKGKKPLAAFEEATLQAERPRPEYASRSAVYDEAAKRAEKPHDFVSMVDIFDAHPEPLFIDSVHLGPEGNKIVAQRIAQEIRALAPKQGKP